MLNKILNYESFLENILLINHLDHEYRRRQEEAKEKQEEDFEGEESQEDDEEDDSNTSKTISNSSKSKVDKIFLDEEAIKIDTDVPMEKELFKEYTKNELFNDCDIIRNDVIVLNNLNYFLREIGKPTVPGVKGYKCV